MSGASAAIRRFVMGIAVGAAWISAPLCADQSSVPRIGILTPTLAGAVIDEPLREGLRELGYIDGQTIILEWRRAPTQENDKLHALAADLARSKVDVIVAMGTPAAQAALHATTVPVVFLVGDPVGTRLAQSLAHPGGRRTGVSMLQTELFGKRLELLRQIAPGIRRVAYLTNSSNLLEARLLAEAESAAGALGVQLVTLDARGVGELDIALRAISRSTADGLIVSADLFLLGNKARIAQAVCKGRLPALFSLREYLDAGGLMFYGLDVKEGQASSLDTSTRYSKVPARPSCPSSSWPSTSWPSTCALHTSWASKCRRICCCAPTR